MEASTVRNLYRTTQARYLEYYLGLAESNKSNFDFIELELDQILRSMELCIAQENWESLKTFVQCINDYLIAIGLWDIFINYNSKLLATDILQNFDEKAMILSQLALISEARGHYSDAQNLYEKILENAETLKSSDHRIVTSTFERLTNLAMLKDDKKEARRLLEKQYQKSKGSKDQVDILLKLANLLREDNEIDLVERYCHRGLEIARQIGYKVGEIDLLRLLASIKTGDDAWNCLQASYELALMLNDRVRIGSIQAEMIKLESIRGRMIFISYNSNNRDFAEKLANDLKLSGLSIWWDEWEIGVGDSIIQKVSEGIDNSGYLIVILSPHSVKSNWVKRELGSALMKQLSDERGIRILPALIADCEIPLLIREIRRADFRTDYQKGLNEILKTVLR